MSRNKNYTDEVVLERAMNVFWNNGFEATSVRLLEKEMGINQFSIYASFKNKKNLFIQSIHKYKEHVSRYRFSSLLQENAGLTELKQFLLAAATKNKNDIATKGCLIVNTATELGSKDADIAREVNAYYDFIRDMLRKVLENAVRNNEIPADTNINQQANFFLGVMQGVSVAHKTMNESQISDFIHTALNQLN